MATLDIFNDDAFSVTSLVDTINNMPHKPGRIGELGYFTEKGITTKAAFIERKGQTLSLVPSAARGAPGRPVHGEKSDLIPISTVHLPQSSTIQADEVQGVRAFGTESEVQTIKNIVDEHISIMRDNIDVTIEYQRIGAIKGQVLDSDGTTVLLDLFSVLGVTQQSHNLVLGTPGTKVRNKIVEAKRKVEVALGGLQYKGLRALCSSSFFDALVGHAAVEAAYDRFQNGQFLRTDVRGGFWYADVYWEEYRGNVGGSDFIPAGEAYLVPEGVNRLFNTYFAPANYMETVNTMGVPYYAKQEVLRMNKGVEIESQSNPISFCSRPQTIVKLLAA